MTTVGLSSLIGCLLAVNVHMPKDRITQAHQGYGFVEFIGEEDADYAIRVMNMIKLFGKPIRVNKVRIVCATYNFRIKQELSYRQQIAHQLCTQYAEGIYRH